MKTYKLSELLGLKGAYARRFNYEITILESKKPQAKSISAQIMANLYKKSRGLERELGFLQDDVLSVEAISALKNKLNDDNFWKKNDASVIFTEDGFVSANKKDVELNSKKEFKNTEKLVFENFQEALKVEILEKYQKTFSNYSKKQLEEKIF